MTFLPRPFRKGEQNCVAVQSSVSEPSLGSDFFLELVVGPKMEQ